MKAPGEVMPLPTAEVFTLLGNNPLLGKFTLIGGTALSLHIGHRISEDLEFITTGEMLPKSALLKLASELRNHGYQIATHDSAADYNELLNAGMHLGDYSQTWLVNQCVKITFFTADYHHQHILQTTGRGSGFTIGEFPILCDLKAIVLASRSKSRDWLDLCHAACSRQVFSRLIFRI